MNYFQKMVCFSMFLDNYINIIKYFVKSDRHTFLDDEKNLDKKLKIFSEGNIKYSFDYDIDINALKNDKNKKLQILNKRRESLESKLNNQNFIKKAPEEVVVSTKNELKNIQKEIFEINKALESL